MMYHDEDEKEVIRLFVEAEGDLILSPPPYWEPRLSTKALKDAFSRLVKNGTIRRGQSHGGHGRRSYVQYHLRESEDGA